MKKISVFVIISILSCSVLITNCKKKDDPKPETARVEELLKSNTWKIQSVTVDGTDQTALFNNMTLTFTATAYTTTNGGLVWPASGTWAFADASAKSITRSDGLEIAINEASATSLKLSLTWAKGTFGPGRVSSIAGNHVFSFVK